MNPLYNTNDSPNNATQPIKAVNRQGVNVPRSHNTFDMSYNNYTTQLYGYYYPFYCFHGVPGDSVPLRSEVDIRSFAMKSPYLGGLTLNKEYCRYYYGSVKNYMSELRYYTQLVRDFDQLCDDLRDYVNEISKIPDEEWEGQYE